MSVVHDPILGPVLVEESRPVEVPRKSRRPQPQRANRGAFPARRAGNCWLCGERFRRGTSIRWYAPGAYVHEGLCFDAARSMSGSSREVVAESIREHHAEAEADRQYAAHRQSRRSGQVDPNRAARRRAVWQW